MENKTKPGAITKTRWDTDMQLAIALLASRDPGELVSKRHSPPLRNRFGTLSPKTQVFGERLLSDMKGR